MNKLIGLLLSTTLLILTVSLATPVFAQEENSTISAKLRLGGSYGLFWPLTAGKTMEDPLYFFKRWKEDFGGLFIFDNARKADYEVMLSTKRILEAEKLLMEKKEASVAKTLDNAATQLIYARGKFSKAPRSGDDFQRARINIYNQLSNIKGFMPKLSEVSKEDLQSTNSKIQDVVDKFLGDVKNP